jgi:hypothetical protein
MEKPQTATSTIYIRLLEEAVTCIRPTQAEPLRDGTYRVLPTSNYDPTDEVWEFPPGSIVHCESFDDLQEPYLLAVAEVGGDGKKKGRTHIAGLEEALNYRDESGHILWHIKSESVALIAEYTTNEGPFGDDWFLVFAVGNKNPLFFTCSVYSDGAHKLLEYLHTRFGATPKLTNSTEWKSVVLWPNEISGAPLIEFSQREPHDWRERLRTWYDGPIKEAHLSVAVRDYLHCLPH